MKQELLMWTLGLWTLLVVCAILNAILRQGVLIPSLGDAAGRALSSITLSAVILVVAYLFLSWSEIERSTGDLWLMGIIWATLTILFEFGFGHYVMGNSWDALLADYYVLKGRIWVLVLVTELVGPYLTSLLTN
ncbi:MAG: hypothetical protein JW880_02280 [Candidatus Thermoplasmatota archaeon]|nr:hypothetical protein [Candidatus Thermoplasmatota archaeon]